jgi:hypothetical protein
MNDHHTSGWHTCAPAYRQGRQALRHLPCCPCCGIIHDPYRGSRQQSPRRVGVQSRALARLSTPPGESIGARAELLLQNAGRASGPHTRARETATTHVGAAAPHTPRQTPRGAGSSLLQTQRRVKRKSAAIQERPVSRAGRREGWRWSWPCGCSGPSAAHAGPWPRIAERPLARRHRPFADDQVRR